MNEQEMFELVRNCYAEANKVYILQYIGKVSIYLTDEQKEQLGLKQLAIEILIALLEDKIKKIAVCVGEV